MSSLLEKMVNLDCCITVWVDSETPSPWKYGYWARSSFEAISKMTEAMKEASEYGFEVECKYGAILLDIGPISDRFLSMGGDFTKVLEYYAQSDFGTSFGSKAIDFDYKPPLRVHFHSNDLIEVERLRRIAKNCPWMEEV